MLLKGISHSRLLREMLFRRFAWNWWNEKRNKGVGIGHIRYSWTRNSNTMYYAFSSVLHNLYVRVFPIWEQNYRLNTHTLSAFRNANEIKSVHFKLFYDLIVSGGKRVWSMNISNTETMAQYLLIAHWNLWPATSHFSRVNGAQDDRRKKKLIYFSERDFFAALARARLK